MSRGLQYHQIYIFQLKMLPKESVHRSIVHKVSDYIPAFTDVFDEESFYIFVFLFVLATIIVAVILARKVDLSDAGHTD